MPLIFRSLLERGKTNMHSHELDGMRGRGCPELDDDMVLFVRVAVRDGSVRPSAARELDAEIGPGAVLDEGAHG